MRKKKIYFILAILFICAGSVKSQVTIGSQSDPHAGSVLDLSKVSGKNLGLLLPQVSLTSATNWSPVSGTKTEGMVVYNTGSVLTKGVYVWVVDSENPNGYWSKVSGGSGDSGGGDTGLTGSPTDWLDANTDLTGNGLAGSPYTKACPNPAVVLTAKSGYTFGAITPTGAGTVVSGVATFTASGSVVISKDGKSGTIYVTVGTCETEDPKKYDPIDVTKGEYSISGNFCYDVFKSDGGTDCGNLSERSNSFASGYEFTYTLSTNKTISDLTFVVEDNNATKITTGIVTNQTAKTGKLTFVTNIKSLFTSGEKKTITVHALFVDQYDQKKKLSMIVNVQDCWCCGAKTLKADNVTYGWLNFMCYNLGAEDSGKDAFAYASGAINGDLYQWGRPKDGHQLRNSSVTATLAPIDIPNHNQFIKTTASPYDWRSGGGQNSRWGDGTANQDMKKAANDPCPTGWKVPSQKQWALLLKEGTTVINNVSDLANGVNIANKWVWTGNGYKVGGALYLPAAGIRNNGGSAPTYVGSDGYYWSSTVNGVNAWGLSFSNGGVYPGSNYYGRAGGMSVRCVAE